MNPLEQRIKYKFRNSLLLAEALTHPSVGHEAQRHHFDNQRLEFLGDAVLQLIFTEYLFERYPNASEGQLTKLRARIVSRDGLKIHAEAIGLGKFLMMGKGEESSGGRERASALSDAYEAVVGALYLDSDYVTARRIVITEAREFLETLQLEMTDQNPKGRLQEILQASDVEAALRENIEEIDDTFLGFLVANIQQAEKAKATAAVRRLRAVYDQAVKILQESMPADLQLLNQLLTAPDESTVRQLLKDNRATITPQFVESLKPLETEMRESGRAELADRIRSLRAQMTLMA